MQAALHLGHHGLQPRDLRDAAGSSPPSWRRDSRPGSAEAGAGPELPGRLAAGTAAEGHLLFQHLGSFVAQDTVALTFDRLTKTFGFMSFGCVPRAFLGAVLILLCFVLYSDKTEGERRAQTENNTHPIPLTQHQRLPGFWFSR